MAKFCCYITAISLGALLCASASFAGQPLETESARLLDKGRFTCESAFEYQTSSEGRETALPMLVEYGITHRLQLALEPVFGTDIHPKIGRRASGIGDLEATLAYLIGSETRKRPAIALAAEVKLPTAKDRLIGTGKTDIAGYLIASRRFAKLDLHANIGYTVLGKPAGIALNNIFSFALAGEYQVSPRWDWVGELFANTSAAPGLGEGGNTGGASAQTAELAGGEAFGMLGCRWRATAAISVALGIVYDNNNAMLLRPGVTIRF